jgi:hypothetical protein
MKLVLVKSAAAAAVAAVVAPTAAAAVVVAANVAVVVAAVVVAATRSATKPQASQNQIRKRPGFPGAFCFPGVAHLPSRHAGMKLAQYRAKRPARRVTRAPRDVADLDP